VGGGRREEDTEKGGREGDRAAEEKNEKVRGSERRIGCGWGGLA